MNRLPCTSLLAGLVLASLAPAAAQAHSPFLLPSAFDVSDRKVVTVQGAFTEAFFSPEVVMKSEAYAVVGPDGKRTALTPVYLRELALVEAPIEAAGTYRITSGQRVGRTAKAALVKGDWVFLENPADAPAGAQVVDMTSITTADVYVTKGAPSNAAVAPLGRGLEFVAVTHPSNISTGQQAAFKVLFDGRPVAGQEITLNAGNDRYLETKAAPVVLKSDAEGRFAVKVEQSGVYQIQARYRVAPAAGGQAGQSHTYALTFESLR